MRMHSSNEKLGPTCIYEFIDCERNLDCNFCELASSRSGLNKFSSYIGKLIDEKGLEVTLDYYYKLHYIFGIGTATAIKEKIGDKPISPDILESTLAGNYKSFGMNYKIIKNSNSIETTIYDCPFYKTLTDEGVNSSIIRQFCEKGKKGESDALKKFFPSLQPFSYHKENINGVCREEYVIARI